MDIERLFEEGVEDGLFTDFQVCVRGSVRVDFSGGRHISAGARLFDVASLSKALTHLLFWDLFSAGAIRPEDSLGRFIQVSNVDGRQLWHFMSYLVQDYGFDFEKLRRGETGSFRDVLLTDGFGPWERRFSYDNYSSAYLGLILERIFEAGLEEVYHEQLLEGEEEKRNLLFHPVFRGLVSPRCVVPTGPEMRGFVQDTLAFSHHMEHISVAGVFSNATVIADVFHRALGRIIATGFYDIGSRNQLEKVGISTEEHNYAMGFDIPYAQSLETSVDGPIIFAGYTGCRLFFAKRPRVTVCFLTNRVFCGDSVETRKRFSSFSWRVIREILRKS